MKKPKVQWGWLRVTTIPGAITVAVVGGCISTLIIEGLRNLVF